MLCISRQYLRIIHNPACIQFKKNQSYSILGISLVFAVTRLKTRDSLHIKQSMMFALFSHSSARWCNVCLVLPYDIRIHVPLTLPRTHRRTATHASVETHVCLAPLPALQHFPHIDRSFFSNSTRTITSIGPTALLSFCSHQIITPLHISDHIQTH